MKKQKIDLKLNLGKETIANLNSHAMANIKGGDMAYAYTKLTACPKSYATSGAPACMNY